MPLRPLAAFLAAWLLAAGAAALVPPQAEVFSDGPSKLSDLLRRFSKAPPPEAVETGVPPLFDSKGEARRRAVPPALAEAARPWRFESQYARLQRSPVAVDGSVRFAVLGDIEPGRFFWSRMLWGERGIAETLIRRMQGSGVEFTMQLGDMVSRGTVRGFAGLFELLSRAAPSMPYFTVLGNHDRHDPHSASDSALYETLVAPANYAFDRGGFRFVSLDTTGDGLADDQLEWLERALLTAPARKFVFIHVPPVQLKRFLTFGKGGFSRGSVRFVELMSRYSVERVYIGHIHGFGTADLGGVRYVLTAGGGSPLYPSPVQRFYHYLVVEAGPGGVRETVHLLDGESFEVPAPAPPAAFGTAR